MLGFNRLFGNPGLNRVTALREVILGYLRECDTPKDPGTPLDPVPPWPKAV